MAHDKLNVRVSAGLGEDCQGYDLMMVCLKSGDVEAVDKDKCS